MIKIFYTLDEQNRVIPACDWADGIEVNPDWIIGDLPGMAYEDHGVPLYKDTGSGIELRTAAEIQADIDALPKPEPTEQEMLRADVDFLLMLLEEE